MDLQQILKLQNPSNAHIVLAIGKLLELNDNSYTKITEIIAETKQHLSQSIQEIKSDVNKINTRIDQIVGDLENTNSCVASLQSEINFLKQMQLDRDLLITGIPNSITNMDDILSKLNKIFNFGLNNVESKYLRTITNRRSGRSGKGTFNQIIIKMMNINSKNIIMDKVRANGPIFLKQMYPSLGSDKDTIIVRERLTQNNNIIMKELLELKKKKKILHCWFRHNNICIKKTADDKPLIIRTLLDVNALK